MWIAKGNLDKIKNGINLNAFSGIVNILIVFDKSKPYNPYVALMVWEQANEISSSISFLLQKTSLILITFSAKVATHYTIYFFKFLFHLQTADYVY